MKKFKPNRQVASGYSGIYFSNNGFNFQLITGNGYGYLEYSLSGSRYVTISASGCVVNDGELSYVRSHSGKTL